jgi:hypothetical protein
MTVHIRGCIQKFVGNEINNNKHSLRSNTKGYGGNTHYNDSQNNDTTARSGRELCHLQFSLQVASSETFGYTLVRCVLIQMHTLALLYVIEPNDVDVQVQESDHGLSQESACDLRVWATQDMRALARCSHFCVLLYICFVHLVAVCVALLSQAKFN